MLAEPDMNDFVSFEFCELKGTWLYVFDFGAFYRHMENLETEYYMELAKKEKKEKRGFL